MTSRRRWPLFATLLFAAAGCAAESRDIRTRLLVQPPTAGALGYRIAWPAELGLKGRERILYAVLLGDKFATFESRNVLSVLDAKTGRMLWRTTVGSNLERFSAPQRVGDQIVICSESKAHFFDAQLGELQRVIDLAHVSNTKPLIHNGWMIHGSSTGIVYWQDLNTGLTRGAFQIGGAAAADPVLCGPLVVVPASTGWVFAFDANSSVPAWRDQVWGEVAAQTAANDEMVFVASLDRSLYAFARSPGKSLRQGREVWRFRTETPLTRRPYVFGDNVYQHVPGEGMVALEAATGKKLWSLPWDDARPFMLKDGRLYVIRPGRILTVTPDDGLVIGDVKAPAVQDVVPQSPAGGDLYLIRLNGKILKLVPQ